MALLTLLLLSCGSDPLTTKAEEVGLVRVIVTLDVPSLPEGRAPTEEELEARRKAIAERRQSLLDRMANYDVSAARSSTLFPFVVMEVDAAALQALRRAPEVVSVQEDRPEAPHRGGN